MDPGISLNETTSWMVLRVVPALLSTSSLPEFMHVLSFLGRPIFVVNIKFGLLWAIHSASGARKPWRLIRRPL